LFGWALRHGVTRYERLGRLAFVCVAVAIVGVLAAGLNRARDAARMRLYRRLPAFIEREVGPDDVVGYVLSNESYLLYGTHFTRTVVYVPAGTDDRQAWIQHLRARHVAFIALGPLRPEWRRRKEVAWVQEADGAFVRVFGQDEAIEPVVYRLNPAPAASS
jgi:hypothetical protein